MSSTKILQRFDSTTKSNISRQNVAGNFSNWDKLLNNVNVIVKKSKKVAEKIKIKEKILDTTASNDINFISVNKQIDDKLRKTTAKQYFLASDDKDDRDDKKRRDRNLILQNIEKNNINRTLEYLRNQYRYYKYLQHQKIIYLEKMRAEKIARKNSISGFLRTKGIPILISVGLTTAVIGINLLFITNIQSVFFWSKM